MLTLLKSPPLVALTGNSVRFSFQTDNYLEEAGEPIVFSLQFSSTGWTDDWIQLTWNGNVIRFVCKAQPDQSGTQIYDNSEYSDLEQWVNKFFEVVSMNYYVASDFIVTLQGLTVQFTAKALGQEYTIEFDDQWTSADKTLAGVSGFDQKVRPFFKVGMQVLLKSGDVWETIGEDLQPVDNMGITTFDIHRLFADRVYSTFRFPEPTQPLILARPFACREYKVRYYEVYGSDLQAQQMTESNSFFILSAGISQLQEVINNRSNTSFWEKLQYNNYFLTWQPTEKRVTRNQTEKLFFLLQEPVEQLQLRIAYFFTNGTGNHSLPINSIDNPTPKTVYELTITPSVMQVPGWETDLLDYYEVWIEDGQMNRISEIRRYTLDYSYQENDRLFLFQNSLGGFDTIRILGDQEDTLEYDRISVKSLLGTDFTELSHHLTQFSVTEIRKHKANTGWITPQASAWIRDFFLSKKVYRIIAGKLVPVVIDSNQVVHRKDKQELFSIDFEYSQSFSNEHYSMELVASELSNDFNGDFANQ